MSTPPPEECVPRLFFATPLRDGDDEPYLLELCLNKIVSQMEARVILHIDMKMNKLVAACIYTLLCCASIGAFAPLLVSSRPFRQQQTAAVSAPRRYQAHDRVCLSAGSSPSTPTGTSDACRHCSEFAVN